MKKQVSKNVAASVMSRLANVRDEKGAEFNILLNRFALERLLYRLSKSEYSDQFVLKGAMLFTLWTEHPHRSTRDLDLLGFGDASKERLVEVFSVLCMMEVEDDGLLFDKKSIMITAIRRD